MARSETGEPASLVLDLLGARELVLAHRRVQVVDDVAFRQHATQPRDARHEAQPEQRRERHEEPAHEPDGVSRGHDEASAMPVIAPMPTNAMRAGSSFSPWSIHDAQRRRDLLRVLEREVDRLGEALGVAVAADRLLVQAALDRGGEARRHGGRDARDRRRRRRELLRHDLGARRAVERQPAGERVVADDAERVEVAARVDRLAGGLLGAHVVRVAHDAAVGGRARCVCMALAMPKSVTSARSLPPLEQDVLGA